jgi:hypothetical protein
MSFVAEHGIVNLLSGKSHLIDSILFRACSNSTASYRAGMNLPLGSRLVVDRTNEPKHTPGELVLLVETLCLEIQARRDSLTSDYILHGSVVRGGKHSYVFAVRRVPSIKGVRQWWPAWRGRERCSGFNGGDVWRTNPIQPCRAMRAARCSAREQLPN